MIPHKLNNINKTHNLNETTTKHLRLIQTIIPNLQPIRIQENHSKLQRHFQL